MLGQCQLELTYKERTCTQQVYVVEGLQNNLLGLPAITSLNLAARVDAAGDTPIQERFPVVFQGLGMLEEEHKIKLKPDAVLHSLFAPRHVPLPLRTKVTEELNRMEAIGVISKVDQPTS